MISKMGTSELKRKFPYFFVRGGRHNETKSSGRIKTGSY